MSCDLTWFDERWCLFSSTRSPEERRDALCGLLAETIGCSRQELLIVRTDRGKPILKNPTDRLFFNIAYREDCLVVAMNWDLPVGVDVERFPCQDGGHVARTFFSLGEVRWLSSLDDPDGTAFVWLWSAKEAVLKAAGIGIALGLGEPDLSPLLVSGRMPDDAEKGVSAFGGNYRVKWHRTRTALGEVMTARALAVDHSTLAEVPPSRRRPYLRTITKFLGLHAPR